VKSAVRALRVLFVEDDRDDLELSMRELRSAGWELDWKHVDTTDALRAALAEHRWDVVVCDYRLGPFEAPEALRIVREVDIDVPFIVVSGTVGEEIAAELMRLGAQDFVMKTNYQRLVPAIIRELDQADHRRRNRDAQEAVRVSEFRFRHIIDAALDAVIAMDADGNVTEWNMRAESMFGWTRAEVVGTQLSALIVPEENREAHRIGMERFLKTGVGPILGERIELSALRRDGTELPVELTVTVLSEGDRPTFSAFVRDMTQRHEAEAEIRASLEALQRSERERRNLVQQLVRASEEERARLAGDVHDDSVQAMTAVGMRLETLKRRLDDHDRVLEVDQLQTTVSDAVSRLRRLLFELRPPALDQHGVAAALRELLDRLDVRSRLDASGFEEPPDELRTILYRVAQESLANVRKHAAASSVTVALESDPTGWRVRVTDDGAGFTPDDDRSDPTHMGLASMRERAEMGAGTCSVTSSPGAGTTVEVFLPRPAV
jgi:PAS domain S-box-containing protein